MLLDFLHFQNVELVKRCRRIETREIYVLMYVVQAGLFNMYQINRIDR